MALNLFQPCHDLRPGHHTAPQRLPEPEQGHRPLGHHRNAHLLPADCLQRQLVAHVLLAYNVLLAQQLGHTQKLVALGHEIKDALNRYIVRRLFHQVVFLVVRGHQRSVLLNLEGE